MRKELELGENEVVLCCWPENCRGPGYRNKIINIIIWDRVCNSYRTVGLQLEDYLDNSVILSLFDALESLNCAFMQEVKGVLMKRRLPINKLEKMVDNVLNAEELDDPEPFF